MSTVPFSSTARAFALLVVLVGAPACDRKSTEPSKQESTPAVSARAAAPPTAPATFVGGKNCVSCHQVEHDRWQGSQHDLAMTRPTPATVRGNFEKSRFSLGRESFEFLHSGNDYSVRVTRAGEPARTLPVRYTFGIDPLQQYLIDVGRGRLQALPVAWDTRSKAEGGQRWFHLHAEDKPTPGHRLHWEGPNYNWNSMCADCHSTGVVRGYQQASGSYDTKYSDVDVSCEACHGPGSLHVAWAKKYPRDANSDRGFAASLALAGARHWVLDDGANVAHLVSGGRERSQLETCAPCHSRRADLGPAEGVSFDDRYRLSFLDEPLYYADGQIHDEVFVYGSFLQSKMHARGVVCSDCHETHSLKLRADGNAMCGTCHRESHYDTPKHHFHPAGIPASQCVTCHMPATTYMVVDPRRDHRFGVPSPALSDKVGSPDVCTGCHEGKSHEWAQAAIEAKRQGMARAPWGPGEALWLARQGQLGAASALTELVKNKEASAIVRASALTELQAYPSRELGELVGVASKDEDPLVRRAAATAADSLPPDEIAARLAPLLDDPVRSVRIEAASAFFGPAASALDGARKEKLQRAFSEYADVRKYNADRPEGLVDLADLARRAGDVEEARRLLEKAIATDPSFSAAHLNLADLYRERSEPERSIQVLEAGLKRADDPAMLEHSLGLALVRAKRHDEGVKHLRAAYQTSPERVRLGYVYAVALFDTGSQRQAVGVLEDLHSRRPGDVQVLSTLVEYCRQAGLEEQADRYGKQLSQLTAQ